MLESMARAEARMRQISALVEEPADGAKQPLTSEADRSNSKFGAMLLQAARREPGGGDPLRGLPPPPRFQSAGPGGLEPMSLPGQSGAEAIRLDPEAAARRERYLPFIREAAAQTGLSEGLIAAVIQAESDFRPDTVSTAGAMGLMQLMPANVRELGVSHPFDPRENILAGARHLRDQVQRFGTLEKALAAYNAGPGAVERYGGIPPYRETQNYVQKITGTLREAGLVP